MTLMSNPPEPGDPRILRYVNLGEQTLMTWDACKRRSNKPVVSFALWNEDNKEVAGGEVELGAMIATKPDSNKVIDLILDILHAHDEDFEILPYTDKEPHQNWHMEGNRYLYDSEANFVGVLLHHWHAGMDAIYGVGSYLVHNRDTVPGKPPKVQVERAIGMLQILNSNERDLIQLNEGDLVAHNRNMRELSFLITYLDKLLKKEGATT